MNKKDILFAILVISNVCFLLSAADEEEKTKEGRRYTTKYDNVDIDAIIKSERLLNAYVGCLLDRNPCTPDAMELKRNLPDALATNCSACSEAQKIAADKLSHHLIDNRPDEWSFLEEKYDPNGDYRRSYQQNKSKEDRLD
ncbi:hypothetical protein KPH14_008744 [Odynerus spinipes]|uniref:Uncharacterized protein n=1 Tax=Odynerus spinipes TaxID=1348599 RepID=A0AAD9VHN9_9HYME|nr:hypothetical protein KPH14_008744 [Odynerus spinipes]